MRIWKKVVLGISVAIGLIISPAMFAASGRLDPVARHFAALKAGNMNNAYAELSISTQKQNSPVAFKAFVEKNPVFAQVVGYTFMPRSYEDGQGLLEATLEIEGGGKLRITIHLVKENDAWRILSYRVQPASSK